MPNKCPNCGADLKKGAKFCQSCGYKLQSKNISSENKSTTHTSQPIPSKPIQPQSVKRQNKKPMSKKNKIIYSVIGALAILFICFYAWGSNYYNRDNQISRIITSLKDPNQNAAQYISCDNSEVKITNQSVKPLQKYFQDPYY